MTIEYQRKHYRVEGDDLDKARRIEVVVIVDGKTLVHVQAREPGIVAFVSQPAEQGFDIEVVEVAGRRYGDAMVPSELEPVAAWQLAALGEG